MVQQKSESDTEVCRLMTGTEVSGACTSSETGRNIGIHLLPQTETDFPVSAAALGFICV